MSSYDRPLPDEDKKRRVRERLERLDRELKTEKSKRFDHINATHTGYTVRICVIRNVETDSHYNNDRDYEAATEFAGRHYRSYGMMPSHAYIRLTKKLSFAIDRYVFELNHRSDDEELEAAA